MVIREISQSFPALIMHKPWFLFAQEMNDLYLGCSISKNRTSGNIVCEWKTMRSIPFTPSTE
uniref:Candidate secreted effector n=1 Tax=Meloidogyne incognita TaxID=6306 RepID=A0A914KQV4_MELIC